MAILGGSPLGLIGVESRPTKTGLSTFNGGRTRNVNVNLYNVGKETDKERMGQTNNTKGGIFSLFTGGNVVRPWANVGAVDYSGNEPKTGIDTDYGGVSRKTLHNNDVYDTSILNLIEKTSNTAAALRPSDFAYLKNLGVYPNNRLMIARRFAGPVADDIFIKAAKPVSIMIMWLPQGENFLELTYGEEWVEAKADFTEMINNIAQDLLGKSVASSLSGMLNAVPLPGFTEGLTRELLTKLGVYNQGSGKILPAGDPNLIKEAKRRKTIKYEEAGSGLRCTCNIKMTVEYEQKFISGIDPTIAWQDIVSNAVRFGTSPGSNYGLSSGFGATLIKWVKDPGSIVRDFASYLRAAIDKVKSEIAAMFEEDALAAETSGDEGTTGTSADDQAEAEAAEIRKQGSIVTAAIDKIIALGTSTINKTISKYTEEVKGIVAALSGMPSTPWHIAVGNPLRPIFCSGDMYTTDVTLSFGPILAFNDLPSTVTVAFTLQNARPWGLTEILAKFNTGHLRTVNTRVDDKSVNPLESVTENNFVYSTSGTSGTAGVAGTSGTSGGSVNSTTTTTTPSSQGAIDASTSGVANTTKENDAQVTVNSNPNSVDPVVQGEKPIVAADGSNNTDSTSPENKASGESKLGYTYTVVKENTNKKIKVLGKDGNEVFTSQPFPLEIPDDVLINKVKEIVGDPPPESTIIAGNTSGPADVAGTAENAVSNAYATVTGMVEKNNTV